MRRLTNGADGRGLLPEQCLPLSAGLLDVITVAEHDATLDSKGSRASRINRESRT